MRKLIHSITTSPFGAPASVTVPLVTALMLFAGSATADEAISPYVTADQIKITAGQGSSTPLPGDTTYNPYVLFSEIEVSGKPQRELLIARHHINPYVFE
jgi:hypothetical protein